MPKRALRPCPEPGCPELIDSKHRACPVHTRDREARKPERMRGRRLQRRRERYRAHNPLCVSCEAKGIVRLWTQLDHRIPLEAGGRDDWENLQGLCDECHAEKTGTEQSMRSAHRMRGGLRK